MDHLVLGERDLEVGIEGSGPSETQGRTENPKSANGQMEKTMSRVWSGHLSFNGSEKIEDATSPLVRHNNVGERSNESLGGKSKKNSRKSSKPPRPPKGPSLSANDEKLVREIAELAMRKRARMERMKTLRKMKVTKPSSSCNSVFAMIVTLVFFLILIFQGLFSTSSATLSSEVSPAPAVASNEGLISVQFYNDFAPRERNNPGPSSFRYVEKRVSGADRDEDARKFSS